MNDYLPEILKEKNAIDFSQSITQLEFLGLIKCSKVTKTNPGNYLLLDLSSRPDCDLDYGTWRLNGVEQFVNMRLTNGEDWNVKYVVNNTAWFYTLLWFSRIALFFLILFSYHFIKRFLELRINLEREKVIAMEKINAISSQVAHDIRSPLAALKMVIEDIESMPEDYRNMIRGSVQRINDIANNLLNTKKSEAQADLPYLHPHFLAPIVDSLMSEKRMQYRHRNNIELSTNLNGSYGLFANINSIEFSRVLSNLINNSVESITGKGSISLSIEDIEGDVLVTVKDNGKGIPSSVLTRLGEAGFSHGKSETDSGSGLGIYHAKKTIESFAGRFQVESLEGIGTFVKIYLPKVPTPSWFVKCLSVANDQQVYVLDDDDSIHKLWNERFSIKNICFTNGELFSQVVGKAIKDKFICLVDYELLGQDRNGLEIIESLKIMHQSFLVTSRYDEIEIREHASRLGVGIIPKTFASSIPIIIHSKLESHIFDCVYIDDDMLMRIGWERKALKKNISLLVLKSAEDFSLHLNRICKFKTKIYIDSNLGKDEMPGEDFAKMLYDQGYKNLYIASGYGADKFAHLPWLKVSGKDCPF